MTPDEPTIDEFGRRIDEYGVPLRSYEIPGSKYLKDRPKVRIPRRSDYERAAIKIALAIAAVNDEFPPSSHTFSWLILLFANSQTWSSRNVRPCSASVTAVTQRMPLLFFTGLFSGVLEFTLVDK